MTNPIDKVYITLEPGQTLIVSVNNETVNGEPNEEPPILDLDGWFTDLYYSGSSARECAKLYGGSHMRYNRAWTRLGLNTSITPEDRTKLYDKSEEVKSG